MNKLQLQALIDACPDEFDVYVDDGTSEYSVSGAEFFFDDGVLVLKVDGAEYEEEEEVEDEEEDALWQTPDPNTLGPVCSIEKGKGDAITNLTVEI